MRPIWRTLTCALGAGGLVLGALTAGQGVASASVSQLGVQVCSGTATSPGQLVGTYDNLEITGQCNLQNGPVTVYGNLDVAPNASLNAVFGLDNSHLTVDGNLIVQKNASVMIAATRCLSPYGEPTAPSPARSSPASMTRIRTTPR